MIEVLFTDTHFGWKNNSITWLNSQMDFIYTQFIPKIKELKKQDKVRVIHLGDVFDSRSTISTYVATKVVKAFSDIRNACDEFIIVAGNHDFYSPNNDTVNTIDLVMGHIGITIVSQDVLEKDGNIYVPWYKWVDRESLNCKGENIFCHGDILHESIPEWAFGKRIYSGHIHIPNNYRGLYNLGSCYSLNFADSNSDRGFYVIHDKRVDFIKNEVSIKFYRFRNEEILYVDVEKFNVNDYIELYISETDLIKQSYIDAIKQFTERFTHIWIIPQVVKFENVNESFELYNIEEMIEASIPEELKHFFEQIKHRLNSNE